jgi:CAAX prenyl protease-like protein
LPPAGKPDSAAGMSTESAEPTYLERYPWVAHAAPFIAWLFCMQMLGDPAGWKYAVRTVLCLALFLALRPWRWYPRLQWRNLGWSVLAGAGVFVLWVGPETDWLSRHEGLHRLYLTVGTMPPWKLDPPLMEMPYHPEHCGWPFTILRLLGSALVISFIEEFFFRGFMYRWMIRDDFLQVPLGTFDRTMFLGVAIIFGLQHREWFAGVLCGLIYGYMFIRTRDVWATGIAHAITNLLLGLYVIWADKYEFWS